MSNVFHPMSIRSVVVPSAVAVNAGSILRSYGALVCGLVTENTIVGFMPGALFVTPRMLYLNACAAICPGIACESATAPAYPPARWQIVHWLLSAWAPPACPAPVAKLTSSWQAPHAFMLGWSKTRCASGVAGFDGS